MHRLKHKRSCIMTDENTLCACAGPKTKLRVQACGNKCETCNKFLVDPIYVETQDVKFKDVLEAMKEVQQGVFGSSPRKEDKPTSKLKAPTFKGKPEENVNHFLIKLRNYFESNGITKLEEKLRVFAQSVDGDAMDLYLTSSQHTRDNYERLESRYKKHFDHIGSELLEVSKFMGLKMSEKQTINEFHIQVLKSADKIKAGEAVVKAVFYQGLSSEYRKHVLLRKAESYEEILAACN